MRKLALTLSALGFIAFAGIAHADQKTENTEKTDSSTTLGGKHKTTRTRKIERADGSTVDQKVETTTPKDVDKRDDIDRRDDTGNVRHDEKMGADEKVEHHTTLTGKKETKTTKKYQKPDGSEVESTTTVTEPKEKDTNK